MYTYSRLVGRLRQRLWRAKGDCHDQHTSDVVRRRGGAGRDVQRLRAGGADDDLAHLCARTHCGYADGYPGQRVARVFCQRFLDCEFGGSRGCLQCAVHHADHRAVLGTDQAHAVRFGRMALRALQLRCRTGRLGSSSGSLGYRFVNRFVCGSTPRMRACGGFLVVFDSQYQ